MLRQHKRLKQASVTEYLLFIEACFVMFFSKLCVSCLPYTLLRPLLGQIQKNNDNESRGNVLAIKQVRRSVRRAANYSFYNSTCLVQALSAKIMLKKRGVTTVLYLGMHKTNNAFGAHAWLSAEGIIVSGDPEHSDCVVINRYY